MPNCFTLTRVGETEPRIFQDIDTELCTMLGVDEDPVEWVSGWYDILGLYLATGTPLDKLAACVHDERLSRIATYLAAHYIVNAWVERAKR